MDKMWTTIEKKSLFGRMMDAGSLLIKKKGGRRGKNKAKSISKGDMVVAWSACPWQGTRWGRMDG